jgi:hypothetical protein
VLPQDNSGGYRQRVIHEISTVIFNAAFLNIAGLWTSGREKAYGNWYIW